MLTVLHSSKSARTRRRGAAAVEFAVVVPIFFLIVFGIFEVARGLMILHVCSHAAMSGARAGVVGPNGPTGETQKAVSDKITAQVNTHLHLGGLNGGQTVVTINGTSPSLQANMSSGDTIRVEVRAALARNSWVPVSQFVNPSQGYLNGMTTLIRE